MLGFSSFKNLSITLKYRQWCSHTHTQDHRMVWVVQGRCQSNRLLIKHIFSQRRISVHIRANTATKPRRTGTLLWAGGSALAFVWALNQPSPQPWSQRKWLQVNQEISCFFILACPSFRREPLLQTTVFSFSRGCGLCGSTHFRVSSTGRWRAYEWELREV